VVYSTRLLGLFFRPHGLGFPKSRLIVRQRSLRIPCPITLFQRLSGQSSKVFAKSSAERLRVVYWAARSVA
jgi:hypothetical protein